jgi:hypothetical protein
MSARHLPGPPLLWSLMAPLTVLTFAAAPQVGAPDTRVATAIEQALVQHRCGGARAAGALETEAHQQCLSDQLASLRTDFGRDLSRLSGADRRTIDSVCSKIDATLERDAYVACLSDQLASLRSRRTRAAPAPAAAAAPPPEATAPTASPPPPAPAAFLWSPALWSPAMWIGGGLVIVLVAAGGVVLALKARRPSRKCRVCGQDVPDSSDLCQKCRHEAAEALRHAATQRVDQQRAQQDELRRQSEREEEQRQQRARQEEEGRLRQLEQARQEEQERQEEQVRRREEEARLRRQEGVVTSDEEFDPHAVLGVPRDASPEKIREAYEEARLKYAPDQVAHLGVELQGHFETKAKAVELAYKKLTE